MEISGHRTRSVFDRYDIVSEADIRDAGARMNQIHRVKLGLSLETTQEWDEGGFTAAGPADGYAARILDVNLCGH